MQKGRSRIQIRFNVVLTPRLRLTPCRTCCFRRGDPQQERLRKLAGQLRKMTKGFRTLDQNGNTPRSLESLCERLSSTRTYARHSLPAEQVQVIKPSKKGQRRSPRFRPFNQAGPQCAHTHRIASTPAAAPIPSNAIQGLIHTQTHIPIHRRLRPSIPSPPLPHQPLTSSPP